MLDTISNAASRLGASAKSMAKMLLQARPATIGERPKPQGPIIIMGNGPSLSQTIGRDKALLLSHPTMAVNFAAIAPEFCELRPRYYIMIDPHFFSQSQEGNLPRLWQALGEVDWPMTLIVPCAEAKMTKERLGANSSIDIATINPVGVEGWKWLEHLAYSKGWGMPRPRNVLIPAIMAAMQLGYHEIYIVGADHSWLKTLSVDDDNHVVSVQPHFYKDDDREVKRINKEYMRYPLHQILQSMYVAFSSYHQIQRYAEKMGIRIYNATPGSYIDAFPRRSLL